MNDPLMTEQEQAMERELEIESALEQEQVGSELLEDALAEQKRDQALEAEMERYQEDAHLESAYEDRFHVEDFG